MRNNQLVSHSQGDMSLVRCLVLVCLLTRDTHECTSKARNNRRLQRRGFVPPKVILYGFRPVEPDNVELDSVPGPPYQEKKPSSLPYEYEIPATFEEKEKSTDIHRDRLDRQEDIELLESSNFYGQNMVGNMILVLRHVFTHFVFQETKYDSNLAKDEELLVQYQSFETWHGFPSFDRFKVSK